MIYIGADHAGFKFKKKLKRYFDSKSIKYVDLGGTGEKRDDYPDFAFKVAKKVLSDKDSRGILICGTGTGMVVAANKAKGIRAAVGYDKYSVVMGRHDNDINVLCLRGRKFSDTKNLKLVKLWLKTGFRGQARYERRLRKIQGFKKENER